MKKTHLIGIVVIAAAILIIISTAGDASSYVTFSEAKSMAANGSDKMVHVVGQLKRGAGGEITGIQSTEDKLAFTFLLVDNNNQAQEVYYNEPMPQDFTKSEKVVVVGSYHGDLFVADKILLKCPSKYQEKEIKATVEKY